MFYHLIYTKLVLFEYTTNSRNVNACGRSDDFAGGIECFVHYMSWMNGFEGTSQFNAGFLIHIVIHKVRNNFCEKKTCVYINRILQTRFNKPPCLSG